MNRKYYHYILILFISIPLSGTMTLVFNLMHTGFHFETIVNWLQSWVVAFPVAYCVALIIVPNARKLVDKINWKP